MEIEQFQQESYFGPVKTQDYKHNSIQNYNLEIERWGAMRAWEVVKSYTNLRTEIN